MEVPGPRLPAAEPGPLAGGTSGGRSGAARAVQTKEAKRWDYFKGLLFLKAAFPVSLPDPRGDLLPTSKFAPKQEKLPSKTRLWNKVKPGLTPPPHATLPHTRARGACGPACCPACCRRVRGQRERLCSRHHVTGGISFRGTEETFDKPVPVPLLPGLEPVASLGPPAPREPWRKTNLRRGYLQNTK